MASSLLRVASEHSSVVAVIGRGHIQGIKKNWRQPITMKDLMEIPSDKSIFTVKRILSSMAVAVAGTAIVSEELLKNLNDTTKNLSSELTQVEAKANQEGKANIKWENCEEQIDLAALSLKEPILFYDGVVLYEDELADNGVSLLTVKVRVMPTSWFLLLRFWLRFDGVLMRLRETRMHYLFGKVGTNGYVWIAC